MTASPSCRSRRWPGGSPGESRREGGGLQATPGARLGAAAGDGREVEAGRTHRPTARYALVRCRSRTMCVPDMPTSPAPCPPPRPRPWTRSSSWPPSSSRRRRGLTQRQLSAKSGVQQGEISRTAFRCDRPAACPPVNAWAVFDRPLRCALLMQRAWHIGCSPGRSMRRVPSLVWLVVLGCKPAAVMGRRTRRARRAATLSSSRRAHIRSGSAGSVARWRASRSRLGVAASTRREKAMGGRRPAPTRSEHRDRHLASERSFRSDIRRRSRGRVASPARTLAFTAPNDVRRGSDRSRRGSTGPQGA